MGNRHPENDGRCWFCGTPGCDEVSQGLRGPEQSVVPTTVQDYRLRHRREPQLLFGAAEQGNEELFRCETEQIWRDVRRGSEPGVVAFDALDPRVHHQGGGTRSVYLL